MKIEILESLGYSYLRHVKQCWLVQANWKVSAHWPRLMDDVELEDMFLAMKERFDPEGKVFKQTKNASQFLQQGEIDVLGVDQEGGVYAVETAFHEAGLNYLGGADARVLKKLLRTMMILKAYHRTEIQFHICFASPLVNPGVQKPLEAVFADLREEYPEIKWDLLTNEAFGDQMMWPTLEKAGSVADTSELFVRAKKLLDLGGRPRKTPRKLDVDIGLEDYLNAREPRELDVDNLYQPTASGYPASERGSLQPLVRNLMTTLLEDYPNLLDEADLRNLMDPDYCKTSMGLQISNFPLLRGKADGRQGSVSDSLDRYYRRLYAGRFYVCSQWWKAHHLPNAESLLQFVEELAQRRTEHPGTPALERNRKALREYVGQPV